MVRDFRQVLAQPHASCYRNWKWKTWDCKRKISNLTQRPRDTAWHVYSGAAMQCKVASLSRERERHKKEETQWVTMRTGYVHGCSGPMDLLRHQQGTTLISKQVIRRPEHRNGNFNRFFLFFFLTSKSCCNEWTSAIHMETTQRRGGASRDRVTRY